jgi:hypothetical protein
VSLREGADEVDCANETGVATVGAGVTKSYSGLLVCRFLVGCFEAGLIPCEEFFFRRLSER